MINLNKVTKFDPARYLDTDEAIDAYINEAVNSNDQRVIDYAFEVVTKARHINPRIALLNLAHTKELTQNA